MEFIEYPKYVYPGDEVDPAAGVLVQDQAEEAAARKSFKRKPAPTPSVVPAPASPQD